MFASGDPFTDVLIFRDIGFIRKWFETLVIIDPSRPTADVLPLPG